MLKISVTWFPGAGLWIVVSTCSKSSSFTMHEHDEKLEIYDNAFKNYF